MELPKEPNEQLNALEKRVRDYYDDNTKMFLKLGADASTKSIHQPLFLTPSDTLAKAMHAQHDMILGRILSGESEMHVLDLGCGVGSSMIYLAQRTSEHIHYTGLTLSPEQADLGNRAVRKLGLESRIKIITGSFLDIPDPVPTVHVAYAIESVIHAPDVNMFFAQVAQRMTSNGTLILFDDFRVRAPASSREERILKEFREGWQGYGLRSVEELAASAALYGFEIVEHNDFSSAQRLNRFRDKLVRLTIPLARLFSKRSSYCTFLIGGNARQNAYKSGLLAYCKIEFRFTRTMVPQA